MESMLNSKRDHHDWKALARDLGNFIILPYEMNLKYTHYIN